MNNCSGNDEVNKGWSLVITQFKHNSPVFYRKTETTAAAADEKHISVKVSPVTIVTILDVSLAALFNCIIMQLNSNLLLLLW